MSTQQTATVVDLSPKPPLRPADDEPRAVLSYGGVEFSISYTLLHHIAGWVAIGMQGTHVDVPTCRRTRQALDYLENVMGWDANPVSPELQAWYEAHRIPAARPQLARFFPSSDAS